MSADGDLIRRSLGITGSRPGTPAMLALTRLELKADLYDGEEVESLRKLLRETLQPYAYGIGSTLAQRISDTLDATER